MRHWHWKYGIFCLETQAGDKGVEQLHLALIKYKERGAKRKVKEVQVFMVNICEIDNTVDHTIVAIYS